MLYTKESSLFMVFNVQGFRGLPLPTNLCPHEPLTKCIEIQRASQPRNYVSMNGRIWTIHEQWTPQLRMIPKYALSRFYLMPSSHSGALPMAKSAVIKYNFPYPKIDTVFSWEEEAYIKDIQ